MIEILRAALIVALAVLWAVAVLWMAVDIRETLRDERVRAFRIKIRNISYEWEARRMEEGEPLSGAWFRDKWDYTDMLHSSRPLKLEKWYTDEEIKRIMS